MIVREEWGTQLGYEKLAPTTSTGFTAAKRQPTSGVFNTMMAKAVLISPETNAIRFRLDATAPTATEGLRLTKDSFYVITGTENVKNFLCIDTGDGASSVKCLFYF